MSGGSYEYAYNQVEQFAYSMQLSSPLRKAFKKHLKLVAEAMKAIEWVDSCDSSEPEGDNAILKVLGKDAPVLALKEVLADADKAKNELAKHIKSGNELLGMMTDSYEK